MPRKSRRTVYDPTVENDQLIKTSLFRDDPLAAAEQEEDIRMMTDVRDPVFHNDNRPPKTYGKCCLFSAVCFVLILVVLGVGIAELRQDVEASAALDNNDSNRTPEDTAPAPSDDEDTLTPTIEPPVETLAQLCSRDRVEQAEFRPTCEEQCQKGACCSPNEEVRGDLESCNSGGNGQVCGKYNDACKMLLLTQVNDDNGSGNEDVAPRLMPAPENLAAQCAMEQLRTPEGYQSCVDMCSPSSCCDLVPSNQGSCILSSHTACLDYHRSCGVLKHVKAPSHELKAPPSNLATICSTSQLQTAAGYQQCESTCQEAHCCGTYCQDDPLCQVYSGPCSLLNTINRPPQENNEHTLPVPPDNLPSICGRDQLATIPGYEACEDACQVADCCRTTCASDTRCDLFFGPCLILSDVPKPSTAEDPIAANEIRNDNGRMHPPPDYIGSSCNAESIQTESGLTACQDICALAGCCNFPTSMPEFSCIQGNEDVCATYHSFCKVLEEGSDELPPSEYDLPEDDPGADLYLYCAPEKLTSPGNIDKCHEICSQATCCYETGAGSCIEDERCDDFDLCFNYKTLYYEHENIRQTVDQNCQDLQHEANLELCEATCEQAVCCFLPAEECLGVTTDFDMRHCDQYEGCRPIMEMEEDPNLGDAEDVPSSGGTGLFNTRDQVDAVCFNDVDFEACVDVCDAGRCCWDPNEVDCNTVGGVDCDAYTNCDMLLRRNRRKLRQHHRRATRNHNSPLGY